MKKREVLTRGFCKSLFLFEVLRPRGGGCDGLIGLLPEAPDGDVAYVELIPPEIQLVAIEAEDSFPRNSSRWRK